MPGWEAVGSANAIPAGYPAGSQLLPTRAQPGFALAIVTVPLVFMLSAFAATHIGMQATRAGALAGAVTFALIILAPSSRNAAVRTGLVCAVTALAAAIAFVSS